MTRLVCTVAAVTGIPVQAVTALDGPTLATLVDVVREMHEGR